MAQYQVPQFLEVEDKIFGPLTFKQFLYLGGGLGLGFISWTMLPKAIAVIVGAPLTLFFIALAFFKYNDRPFIFLVESMFSFLFSKKLYLWRKMPKTPEKRAQEMLHHAPIEVPKLSDSKLRSLSWELDVHESLEAPQEGFSPQSSGRLNDKFKF